MQPQRLSVVVSHPMAHSLYDSHSLLSGSDDMKALNLYSRQDVRYEETIQPDIENDDDVLIKVRLRASVAPIFLVLANWDLITLG